MGRHQRRAKSTEGNGSIGQQQNAISPHRKGGRRLEDTVKSKPSDIKDAYVRQRVEELIEHSEKLEKAGEASNIFIGLFGDMTGYKPVTRAYSGKTTTDFMSSAYFQSIDAVIGRSIK